MAHRVAGFTTLPLLVLLITTGPFYPSSAMPETISATNQPADQPKSPPSGELSQKAAPVPVTKAQVIALAARLARAAPQLSRIWPGYWPEEQAFIVHVRGQGAVLVSPAGPAAGFVPMDGSDVPPELAGRAYYHEGTMEGATRPFVLGYPVAEGRTAVLVNAHPSAEETASLILHEQFHAYQSSAFKGRDDQFVDPLAVRDRVAFAAAAQTEKRILAAALSAKTAKERKELLRHYFALRRERESTVPPALRLVEQGFERTEGTAKYVDRVGHAILFGNGMADLEPLLIAELTKTEPASPGPPTTQRPMPPGGSGAGVTPREPH